MAIGQRARVTGGSTLIGAEARAAQHVSTRRSRGPGLLRHLDSAALFGLALTGAFVLAAAFAPLLMPHDPLSQDVARRLKPPGYANTSGAYLLGTDGLGRDVLSRLIAGAQVSLLVGLGGAVISALAGTALGLLAGYFGGWLDALIMRLVDIWQAVPYTVLAIAIVVVLGPSLVNVILVLGLTSWVNYARVIRAEALTHRRSEIVLAARVIGAGDVRILARHVMPLVLASIVVLTSMLVGSMILFEAALSFLGLGVQPPTPSWGNMILDGLEPIRVAWWVSFFPGLAILLAVMGINLVGDWLRDVLDPRLRAAYQR
jgi:peptide/nickel transport system permease protein